MKRRLLNLLTTLSLLLFGGILFCACAGAVLPGGWGTYWTAGPRVWWVDTNNGFVSVTTGNEYRAGRRFIYPGGLETQLKRTERRAFPGVRVGRSHRAYAPAPGGFEYRWVRVHVGYFLVAAVALPAAPLFRRASHPLRDRTRRMRANNGLCPVCRYDLRATPGRCPECGGVGGRAAG